MNARLTRAAGNDAIAAAVQLEHFRPGWGDDFEVEMRDALTAIVANPHAYPRTEDGPDAPETRNYYIARFEYRVIYAIWQDEAVIVAVTHARLRPGSWLARLTDLTTPEDST